MRWRSSPTAAMAASTASSPSFLAHCATPRSKSLRVYDSSALAKARTCTRFSRSLRVNDWAIGINSTFLGGFLAPLRRGGERRSRVEPHRQARLGHVLLGVAHRKLAEMKDRGREHGGGMA